MYCKANFKSVAKCKKRLCTAVFALFKKNTRRVAWPVLQSRCKALSALSQNTLKNTKTGRKSVGFLILTQAPKCTRSHCFPPQKHPKNGFVMRFAGKNSFFQLRARDFSFYMNAYNTACNEFAKQLSDLQAENHSLGEWFKRRLMSIMGKEKLPLLYWKCGLRTAQASKGRSFKNERRK